MIKAIFKWFRDQAHIEKGICPLHKTALQSGTIPIKYGLVRHSDEYLRARRAQFPEAHSWATGGCIVSKTFPNETTVMYCQRCRDAEASWHTAKAKEKTVGGESTFES